MRVVQVGTGKMSVFTMRYVQERGGEIVGAYVRKSAVGKDIGDITGGSKTGVIIEAFEDMDASIKKLKPEIAIVTTHSLLKDIYPIFEILAKNHVNIVTICEESFYPWESNPLYAKKIDELAKKYGITITGSGYQDVSWGSMVTALCATAANINTIHGISSYNIEDYGLETARMHGAGLKMEDFEKDILGANNVSEEEMKSLIDKGEFLPGYMFPVNGWITSALGLHTSKITQKAVATTYEKDLYSNTLKRTVPAGDATGLKTITTTETEEGITIITECIGKIFAPDEKDINEWSIEGEPNMRLEMEGPATDVMTCACCVNRMPDVIAAEPGFITTDKMPNLKFHRKF